MLLNSSLPSQFIFGHQPELDECYYRAFPSLLSKLGVERVLTGKAGYFSNKHGGSQCDLLHQLCAAGKGSNGWRGVLGECTQPSSRTSSEGTPNSPDSDQWSRFIQTQEKFNRKQQDKVKWQDWPQVSTRPHPYRGEEGSEQALKKLPRRADSNVSH